MCQMVTKRILFNRNKFPSFIGKSSGMENTYEKKSVVPAPYFGYSMFYICVQCQRTATSRK